MTTTITQSEIVIRTQPEKTQYPAPLKLSGALDQFKHVEVTPVIGREYPNVNVVDDILNAKNSDELLRDLAITSRPLISLPPGFFLSLTPCLLLVSQRGVVFFRAQDNLTDDLQKTLVHRLGQLSGKPADSTLHIHPLLNSTHEFGVEDNEISTISSAGFKLFPRQVQKKDRDDRKGGAASWHSDIQFEEYPADYTSLRLVELPASGGDTLWASGYELYDRFSDPYRRFLEGLTATYTGEGFHKAAQADPERFQIYEKPRGNPANIGGGLTAVHPVVRTNPVTGWKSLYAIGNFPQRINELSAREGRDLLDLFKRRIEENHDLQVRFKWTNKNDLGK